MTLDLDVVLAPNPSPMTGRGTNTYVLGHGDQVAVVDPGPADTGHLDAVEAAVQARGRAALVIVTHHHVDHSEAAEMAAERLGAPVATIPHPKTPRVDRPLEDGTQLGLGELRLTVLHTPGHSRDHLCLLWEEERAVFVGDLVATEGFIVIDPPEGNMADYLASLRRIRDLGTDGPTVLLPGHGAAIENPRQHLDRYVRHRLEREAKVLEALSTSAWRTPEEILPVAYADTPEPMRPVAARSLQAHIEKLVDDGRADGADGRFRRTR
jgi:glyoxylase-like metal-dependent hydrolase (beta-lactamase superfamily II)